MKDYLLDHLDDAGITRGLDCATANNHSSCADQLAHIAALDARRQYREAGYPSTFAYCMGRLHLSEDATAKRIYAGRAARKWPILFEAIADGRLHLTGLSLLAPRLTADNACELLAATTHKSVKQIRVLLAERFPSEDVPTLIRRLPAPKAIEHVSKHVESVPAPLLAQPPGHVGETGVPEHVSKHVEPVVTTRLASPSRKPARVTPLSPQRYALQGTIDQEFHDLLEEAKGFLGHELPGGSPIEVLRSVLREFVTERRRRKLAETSKPRPASPRARENRHIPSHIKRAVVARDGNQCTFVSEDGHRCEARASLEFDHIEPYARGGQATVDGIRQLCRPHNQLMAERAFGAEFMRHKRIAATA